MSSTTSSESSNMGLSIPCAKSLESKLNEQIEKNQKQIIEKAVEELKLKQLESITVELQQPLCKRFEEHLVNKGYTVSRSNYTRFISNKLEKQYKVTISVVPIDMYEYTYLNYAPIIFSTNITDSLWF